MDGHSIAELTEISRAKMIEAINTYGITSTEAVQASQELDDLLNCIQSAPMIEKMEGKA